MSWQGYAATNMRRPEQVCMDMLTRETCRKEEDLRCEVNKPQVIFAVGYDSCETKWQAQVGQHHLRRHAPSKHCPAYGVATYAATGQSTLASYHSYPSQYIASHSISLSLNHPITVAKTALTIACRLVCSRCSVSPVAVCCLALKLSPAQSSHHHLERCSDNCQSLPWLSLFGVTCSVRYLASHPSPSQSPAIIVLEHVKRRW
jgi:hypothetical protein